jgi:hypothetical protein
METKQRTERSQIAPKLPGWIQGHKGALQKKNSKRKKEKIKQTNKKQTDSAAADMAPLGVLGVVAAHLRVLKGPPLPLSVANVSFHSHDMGELFTHGDTKTTVPERGHH